FTKSGIITLRITPDSLGGSEALRFAVSDTGIGIPPERMADLFQPFAQIGTARKQGGTGLGLAITKRFCELMGGAISVKSEPGKGSEFVIVLPRKSGSPVAEDRASTQTRGIAPRLASRPTVLVIDDDPAARELMHR